MYIPRDYYKNYEKNRKKINELLSNIETDLIYEKEKNRIDEIIEKIKELGEDYIANKIENGELKS